MELCTVGSRFGIVDREGLFWPRYFVHRPYGGFGLLWARYYDTGVVKMTNARNQFTHIKTHLQRQSQSRIPRHIYRVTTCIVVWVMRGLHWTNMRKFTVTLVCEDRLLRPKSEIGELNLVSGTVYHTTYYNDHNLKDQSELQSIDSKSPRPGMISFGSVIERNTPDKDSHILYPSIQSKVK